jgi:lipoprotein-anchoring transpeptidase ErfK/SrfK
LRTCRHALKNQALRKFALTKTARILRKINAKPTKRRSQQRNVASRRAWFTNRCLFASVLSKQVKSFVSSVMQRSILISIAASLLASVASAQPVTPPMVVVAQPQRMQASMGGGFIEYLFGDNGRKPQYGAPPEQGFYGAPAPPPQPLYANTGPIIDPTGDQDGYPIDPVFLRQEVIYQGPETPGTIVIDTPQKFLYLVQPGGRALRYGIGVGRPGFTWSGMHTISTMKEWPDWVPPKEMLERQPYLPKFMAGGPSNPLGARAMYLGSTLYRIHGSNEPWTIGQNVSSGCIRMRNADVIDLYGRVKVGAKVLVL